MIHPAPTSKIDPKLARGTLVESTPSVVKVAFPNTNYELHLVPQGAISTPPGKRIIGAIAAKARRIDVVRSGGRYIEPVFGRPRRVQGSVVAVLPETNTVVVDAGVPVQATPTDPRQKATDFEPGQFVSFDVLEGATLTPAPAAAPSPTP